VNGNAARTIAATKCSPKVMRSKVQGLRFKISELRTSHPPLCIRAFTLVEMLVVIAIIGILAALILGVLPSVTEKRTRSRVKTELAAVETVIASYKEKKGFFPPDNLLLTNRPSLYYELTATDLPPKPNPIRDAAEQMGITNIVNVGAEDSHNFYKNVRQSQVTEINGVQFLGIKTKGPNDETFVTFWYDSHSPNRHNHEGFDLWVDVKVSGKIERIGNWND
jgi:prepilin-type N-terminal cleavage/methylation domain-containing protein